ncbi:hypothetical protein [Streptomyces longispororuber]|uniref:hypothetical protein n=1 Tax=Streptomyces longispororuber TaxID=68230 RepID=UPI0036FD6A58
MTHHSEDAVRDAPGDVPDLRAVTGPLSEASHRHERAPSELPPDRNQAILEATKQVAALLKRHDHDFALAGSVAVYAHGGTGNLQHDADFCIKPEDAETVAATLAEAGLKVYTPPEDWLLKAKCLGQDIDLIYRLAGQPVSSDLLGRAHELRVDSVAMPVLAPTDLLRSLLGAFSEHHCDFGAVLPIARLLREKVDWEGIRREWGEQPMPAAFLFLLERLEIIAPRTEQAPARTGPSEGPSRGTPPPAGPPPGGHR